MHGGYGRVYAQKHIRSHPDTRPTTMFSPTDAMLPILKSAKEKTHFHAIFILETPDFSDSAGSNPHASFPESGGKWGISTRRFE